MPSPSTTQSLLQRFGGATPEMLDRVLNPYRLRIKQIHERNKNSKKPKTGFVAELNPEIWTTFEEGTTGKVVPREYVEGEARWRELIKGRILKSTEKVIEGELYFDAPRFNAALAEVKVGDYLEIDPFGVTSKIESALSEAAFFLRAKSLGFDVARMPENVAKHVGTQNYYDFTQQSAI